ncbi:hypothetical protein llap_5082 [Limosa lapponica baueri]|uniref:Uncharacterized protein n=1 Tax=Limosa lapponica baueri TaxID=1758121 RepID=A0A2I0UEY4_LIMLA|nr:hypothetical protein llap_5082 [Limosa lapponica baueri]
MGTPRGRAEALRKRAGGKWRPARSGSAATRAESGAWRAGPQPDRALGAATELRQDGEEDPGDYRNVPAS